MRTLPLFGIVVALCLGSPAVGGAGLDLSTLFGGSGRPVNAGQALVDGLQSGSCKTLKSWLQSVPDSPPAPTATGTPGSLPNRRQQLALPGAIESGRMLALVADDVFPRFFKKPYDLLTVDDLRRHEREVAPLCRRLGSFTPAESQLVSQIWFTHGHAGLSAQLAQQRQVRAAHASREREALEELARLHAELDALPASEAGLQRLATMRARARVLAPAWPEERRRGFDAALLQANERIGPPVLRARIDAALAAPESPADLPMLRRLQTELQLQEDGRSSAARLPAEDSTRAALNQRVQVLSAADEERRRARAVADAKPWHDGATPGSAASDTALFQQIDQTIRNLTQAKPGQAHFRRVVEDDIHPKLLVLAGSAFLQGQHIAAGAAGRPAFERWDSGAGGQTMVLFNRLMKIWPTELALVGKLPAIFNDVANQYRVQVDEKGAIDPAYMSRIMAALARMPGQRRDATPPPAPMTMTTSKVVFLRPDQVNSYLIARAAGEVLADRARMAALVEDLEANIVSSRRAFWACLAKRCADIAPAYLEYSRWLKEKDGYALFRFTMSSFAKRLYTPKEQAMVDQMMDVAAAREVDGGTILGCSAEYRRWISPVVDFVASRKGLELLDTAAAKRFADDMLNTESNAHYQRCRDAMEFAQRPRS